MLSVATILFSQINGPCFTVHEAYSEAYIYLLIIIISREMCDSTTSAVKGLLNNTI